MKPSSAPKFVSPAKQGLYDPAFEHDACGVGFVANIKNRKSHGIIEKGMEILIRLTHRGATGADPREGDGAGILIQIPDDFFRSVTPELKIELPKEGEYGIGMVFLPRNDDYRAACEQIIEQTITEEGQAFLGWRDVPTDTVRADLPESVTCCKPVIRQVFIGKGRCCTDQDAFERKLYVIRRVARNRIDALDQSDPARFYFASMSSRTLVYKGMFLSHQVGKFYEDLHDTKETSLYTQGCCTDQDAFERKLYVIRRVARNRIDALDQSDPARFYFASMSSRTLVYKGMFLSHQVGKFYEDLFTFHKIIIAWPNDSCVETTWPESFFSHAQSPILPFLATSCPNGAYVIRWSPDHGGKPPRGRGSAVDTGYSEPSPLFLNGQGILSGYVVCTPAVRCQRSYPGQARRGESLCAVQCY